MTHIDPKAIRPDDYVTLTRGDTSITDRVTLTRYVRATGLSPSTYEVRLALTKVWHLLNPSPCLDAWTLAAHTPAAVPTAPEVEPGTVGTATVRGVEGVRDVMRTDGTGGSDAFWVTPTYVRGFRAHGKAQVTAFVPDPDTAALRAEVERLHETLRAESDAHVSVRTDLRTEVKRLESEVAGTHYQWREQYDALKTRADTAEARLARVTKTAISDLWAKECGVPGSMAAGFINGVLALVAADEQAAEDVRKPHDPSCNLATSPCADCLQQAHRG